MAEEPQIFAYEGPTGWKLDTADPRDNVFTVGGLTPASALHRGACRAVRAGGQGLR